MKPVSPDHTRPTLGQYIQIYNIRKKIEERKKSKQKGHPITFQTEIEARMAGTHHLMDHHMNETKTQLEDILMNTGMNKQKLFFAVAKKLDQLMVKLKTDITEMYKDVEKQYMIENQGHPSHINPATVKYLHQKVQQSSEEKKKTNLNEVIKDNFKKAEKTQQFVNMIFGKSQDKNQQINLFQQPEPVKEPVVLSAKDAKKAKRLAKAKSISQDFKGLKKSKSEVTAVKRQSQNIIKPLQIINQLSTPNQKTKIAESNNQQAQSFGKKSGVQTSKNNMINKKDDKSPPKAEENKTNDKPITTQKHKLAVPEPVNRPNSFMDVIFSLSTSPPAPQIQPPQESKNSNPIIPMPSMPIESNLSKLVNQKQQQNTKSKSKSPQKPKVHQHLQLPKSAKSDGKKDNLNSEVSPSQKSSVGFLKRNQIKNDVNSAKKRVLIKGKSPKT